MTEKTLDDLRMHKGSPRGRCKRCGEAPPAASVQLLIRESEGPKGALTSLARSLCEPCAVECYTALRARFEEMLGEKR
jgi:hypothetical protein